MSYNKLIIAASFLMLIFGYMNCGQMQAPMDESWMVSSSTQLDPTGVIYSRTSRGQLAKEMRMYFYSGESYFQEPVRRVIWDHNFNGTDFCEQNPGEDMWSVEMICDQAGELNIFLIVEYESGIDESYYATVDVLEEPIEEVPEDDLPGSSPVPLDGQMLYASACAGCHGGGSVSEKRGRSAAQIQAAIDNNEGGMGFLSNLSSEEIEAIANYLNE